MTLSVDLDPGLEGEDRQTGASFIYFHFTGKERKGSIRQSGQLRKPLVETRRNVCLFTSGRPWDDVVGGRAGQRGCNRVGNMG